MAGNKVDYQQLWEYTFNLNSKRCPSCDAIIDNRLNCCTLCSAQKDNQKRNNCAPGPNTIEIFKLIDNNSSKVHITQKLINITASYIETGLDKSGDSVISIIDKLIKSLTHITYKKP